MKRFRQLIKKDWRLNRATVMGLVIMNLVAYCLGLAAYLWDRYTSVVSTPQRLGHSGVPFDVQIGAPLRDYMRAAAAMGLIFTVLAAAVFGAGAFAIERRERSADFLAMLPVKRSRIIASKLLVAFLVLAAAMVLETSVLLCSAFRWEWENPGFFTPILVFVASGLMLFAIAWLLSTFMSSTAIAASVAIVIAGCGAIVSSPALKHLPMYGSSYDYVMLLICAAGIFFVLAGSAYYIRRVAP